MTHAAASLVHSSPAHASLSWVLRRWIVGRSEIPIALLHMCEPAIVSELAAATGLEVPTHSAVIHTSSIMDIAQGTLRITHYLEHKPRPRGFFYGSRSLNPIYPQIHKLDDVTRYNSANTIVTRYQDAPNRCSTPKRPNTEGLWVRSLKKPPPSPRTFYLTTMMRSASFVSPEAKKQLFGMARNARIRVSSQGPYMQKTRSQKALDVMNDFHKRETNAGFARNQLGGFFTH